MFDEHKLRQLEPRTAVNRLDELHTKRVTELRRKSARVMLAQLLEERVCKCGRSFRVLHSAPVGVPRITCVERREQRAAQQLTLSQEKTDGK